MIKRRITMNIRKYFKSKFFGRRLIVLLTALLLVVGLFINQLPDSALGMRREDPTDTDPIGVGDDPPPYTAPAGGFSWSMEKRFGLDQDGDGMIDYHWDRDSMTYDPVYVYPTSWKITFNGCQTGNDNLNGTLPAQYDYTYTWRLDGVNLTTLSCKPTLIFTDKSTHPMGLTVTKVSDGSTQTFPDQTVQVKDYFIVSLGDSYASGQGNPDIEQVVDPGPFGIGWRQISPAQWQDERCHRSANAAPALAAMALEASDPHSSVTFISFACTGATILTPNYDPVYQDEQLFWGLRGSGILGPQRGEITDVAWGDYDNYIPAQMTQLETALAASNGQLPRQIDALLISGGGNDMKFAPIMKQCILFMNCWTSGLAEMQENPTTDTEWYTLTDIVTRAVGLWEGANPPQFTVPGNYADLGARINLLVRKPAHVYVTQYPDPTINNRGVSNEANETYEHHCRMLDDVLWPNPLLMMDNIEARYASHFAQTKLNDAVRNSVATLASTYPDIDWQFVDGISVFDVDPNPAVAGKPGLFVGGPDGGPGHGYCADDNWIRRADEAELIQGPVNWRAGSVGTMHPNYSGQQAIKSRILRYMLPDLTIQSPAEPPSFSFSYSSGGLTSQPGLNGWYLQSCDSGNVCYPKVVGQAVATSTINLNGASISVNDTGECSIAGVACDIDLSTDQKQITYKIEISATGTYRFQFNALDANGQAAFLQKEIKVDLENPVIAWPFGPFEVAEGGSVVVSASVATDAEGIPLNGDVLVDYDWDLDHNGTFPTTDEQPEFSAAGYNGPTTQDIRVLVTDRAGRTAIGYADVNITNVAPLVAIDGVPATSYEGTAINLTSSVTDPGALDTFTYAWVVKKDGTSYATSTAATLSFTPDDNGAYEVSLSVTDDDGGVGTVSQTISVLNVAPAPTILDAPASPVEGTAISLTSSATDPGADTFSGYAWSVKKNGSAYASGSGASFSFTPDDNGAYEVSLSVTDEDGGVGTTSQTITVTNAAPVLSNVTVSPGTANEGSSVTLSVSISDASSADAFHMDIDWGDGSPLDNVYLAPGTTSFSQSHTYADDDPTGTASDSYVIGLTIYDDDGGTGTGSASVVVNNLAPSLTISTPESGALYMLNAAVDLSAALMDASTLDTLTCSVNWGDGFTETGTLAAGVCTASHVYTATGVYTIQVTGSDDDTGAKTGSVMAVVYDPSAGFVTGGGWIASPTRAYKPDESLSGKATFGFVSKYQKGATVPSGNTAFEFEVGGFEFYSTAYEWLVVNQNGANAQFKGSGLINGALDPNGNAYKFMLWASDGSSTDSADTFRIRIWWEDAAGEHVVYDNGTDQAIGGGSIVIHSNNK
jgi:hypothetical protein